MGVLLTRRKFATGVAAVGAGLLTHRVAFAANNGPTAGIPKIKSTFAGVRIGCNTSSLGNLPLDEAIRVIAEAGYGMAELHPNHIEPVKFREAAKDEVAAKKLRDWRLTVPLEQFHQIRNTFQSAGLFLYAYNANLNDNVTDEELDRCFQITQALGCKVMSAVGSKQLLRRLDPFAQKHKVWIGAHNDVMNLPTIEEFDDLLKGSSSYMDMTLDIGHFVASGSDPVAALNTHHSRIVDLHLKDRKKSNGPNMPFGEGDTPVADILRIVRDRKYPIPLNVEWEAAGSDRPAALRACLDYCKRILESA